MGIGVIEKVHSIILPAVSISQMHNKHMQYGISLNMKILKLEQENEGTLYSEGYKMYLRIVCHMPCE